LFLCKTTFKGIAIKMNQVIIVGGGLGGMSAAHTVLEKGIKVCVIDKAAFFGGNSTKATSGINGALTKTQRKLGVTDSAETFAEDTMRGGAKRPDLVEVLCGESAPSVDWLVDKFKLDLSLVARLGGHSNPRTHRGKERFPGMTITYALMEALEEIADESDRAKIMLKSKVTKLIKDAAGNVMGVEGVTSGGEAFTEHGPVIICTGGFGADFGEDSLLVKYRPDLAHLPTTNGDHCTGDGLKMAMSVGADCVDLEWIQVHPTGLVHPDEPDAKVKFLAAEALRGVGGVLLDMDGKRFCNELGRRDYVTGMMWKNKGFTQGSTTGFFLCLNGKSSEEIHWHCKHYKGRGLMKYYKNMGEFAKEHGMPLANIEATFKNYNEIAAKQAADPDAGPYEAYGGGKSHDVWGKKFFHNLPLDVNDEFHVGIVTPVIHYCMGGLKMNPDAEILRSDDSLIGGLYAAGEAMGGVHGNNRLGGNSLLDCVVFGRVSARSAARYLQAANIKYIASTEIGTNAFAKL
jgi:flavocytochrome c